MLLNRERKPLPAEEYKFVVPDIQKFTLNNGLKIMLVERHTLPIIRINFMADCGSRMDPSLQKGLSNLFSMCIDEGAGGLNALQLASEFDLLGSDFDIHCTNDSVYFLSRSLNENLERTIELFSNILQQPHFNEEEFEKEKRKVLTRILQTKDDPDEIAANAFEYLVFNRSHPYSFPVIGRQNDINSVKINDIRQFYENSMLPSDSYLIFSGNITREETERLAYKYFSEWMSRPVNGTRFSYPVDSTPGIYFVDKPGAVQSEIRVGHLTEKRTIANYFPRLLLNLALGGQFSSRINLNLRENKGYTYGAFSTFNYYKHSGYFYVSTSVNSENTLKALQEIKKEITEIKNGITPEELLFAKTSLMRKFPSNFETNGQIASSLSRMILYDLTDDHFANYIQNIHDVTIEKVNKAGEEYIFPEKLITLIVGDKSELLKQFGKEDLFELDINGNVIKEKDL